MEKMSGKSSGSSDIIPSSESTSSSNARPLKRKKRLESVLPVLYGESSATVPDEVPSQLPYILLAPDKSPPRSDARENEPPDLQTTFDDTVVSTLPTRRKQSTRETSSTLTIGQLEDLLRNIQVHLPKRDAMSSSKRANRLDWSQVAVDGVSAEECRRQWNDISSKVRRYRTMEEVLHDASAFLRSQSGSHLESPDKVAKTHPDFPIQPPNIYLRYRLAKMTSLKQKHPTWSYDKLSKCIIKKYKTLPSEPRAELTQQFAEDKQIFLKAKRRFYKGHPEYRKKIRGGNVSKSKGGGHLELPDPPLSPFALFQQHFTEQYPSDAGALATWTILSEDDQMPFLEKAYTQEQTYKEKIADFSRQHPDVVLPRFKSRLSAVQRRLLQPAPDSTVPSGCPSQPIISHSPYQLFLSEFLETVSAEDKTDWYCAASETWRKMDSVERDDYRRRIDEIWTTYYQQMEEYLGSLPESEQGESRKRLNFDKLIAKEKRRLQRKKLSDRELLDGCNSVPPDETFSEATPLNGKDLFIYENERDFRCTFPQLTDDTVRSRLGQMFVDLPQGLQEQFEERARRFEDDVF